MCLPVQVQHGQNGSVTLGVQKLVAVPTGSERTGFLKGSEMVS